MSCPPLLRLSFYNRLQLQPLWSIGLLCPSFQEILSPFSLFPSLPTSLHPFRRKRKRNWARRDLLGSTETCTLKRNNRFLSLSSTGNLWELCHFEAKQTQCTAVKEATVGTFKSLFSSHHILVCLSSRFSSRTVPKYSIVFRANIMLKYFKCQTKYLEGCVDYIFILNSFFFKGTKRVIKKRKVHKVKACCTKS